MSLNIAEEVLKRADTIGLWLAGKIEQTVDFATQQAIDIAVQYIAFGRAYHTAVFLMGVALILLAFYCASKTKKYIEEDSPFGMVPLVGGMFSGLIGPIVLLESFKEFVMVWAAPKVWLIIELTELVNKGAK